MENNNTECMWILFWKKRRLIGLTITGLCPHYISDGHLTFLFPSVLLVDSIHQCGGLDDCLIF